MAVFADFIWLFWTQETGHLHQSVSFGFCWLVQCGVVQCVPKERGCNSLLTGQACDIVTILMVWLGLGCSSVERRHSSPFTSDSWMPGLFFRSFRLFALCDYPECHSGLYNGLCICLLLLCFFLLSLLSVSFWSITFASSDCCCVYCGHIWHNRIKLCFGTGNRSPTGP